MIKTRKFLSAIVALSLSVGMVACSDDGDTGPAGPAGNANVKSSTYTIMPSDWTGGNATVLVPGITEDIANNGQVAVYFTTIPLEDDSITWNPLPYRFAGPGQFITVQNTVSIGKVVISARSASNLAVSFNNDTRARVVLIPSTAIITGVDVNNYLQVKEVYGIEEVDLNL